MPHPKKPEYRVSDDDVKDGKNDPPRPQVTDLPELQIVPANDVKPDGARDREAIRRILERGANIKWPDIHRKKERGPN